MGKSSKITMKLANNTKKGHAALKARHAAQPGQLAFGELARGGNAFFAKVAQG